MKKKKSPSTAYAEFFAKAELAHAIATIGRLLPENVSVRFYRNEDDEGRVTVEVTEGEDEQYVTTHWADQVGN